MGEQYIINDKINFFEIYSVYVFVFFENSIEIIITLIGINNKKFLEYYKQNNNICNKNFITNLYIYHKNYENINTDNQNLELITEKNINSIIAKSLKPSDFIIENMIPINDFLNIKLYNYQRKSIKWMIDIENNKNTFHISRNSLDEIKLGNITFDPYTKDFKLIEDKLKINFTGGALIDEVGLGKTIQSIMLCILNPPLHINYTLENNINIFSRATLIICPNQLCGQWTREFKKMINTKKKKFIIYNILTKSHFEKLTYFDLLDADFVIISYNFLGNQHFLNKWLPQISNKKSYMSSKQYDYNTVDKLFEKILKK